MYRLPVGIVAHIDITYSGISRLQPDSGLYGQDYAGLTRSVAGLQTDLGIATDTIREAHVDLV